METGKPNPKNILAEARRQGAAKRPQPVEQTTEEVAPNLPLLTAALDGDLETLRSELAAGASIDQVGSTGETPLCYALRRHHWHIAHYLVDAGADVECINAETPPLLDAITSSDCVLVEKMLARGADIQRQSRNYRWSALMKAQTEEMIAFLISRGASFNARNKAGFDAIEECRHQAAAIRRHEAERSQYYARLRDASSYDPVLQEKLLRGLSELSRESVAKEYDERAAIMEKLRQTG